MHTLTAKPKDYRIIPIEDFLKLSEVEKANIRRVKILAPDLDDEEFGYMQVFYTYPIYDTEVE